MVKLNKNEQKFIYDLGDVDASVRDGYELEINHWEEPVLGWYPYEYSGAAGQSYPIEGYEKPLISDKEAKEKGIDVVKCFNKYGCFYVG